MKKNDNLICNIEKIIEKTYNKNVLSKLNDFSGLYKIIKSKFIDPIIVSSTDGVGTKIFLAINYKKYEIIGKDCFAMCINDILCHGATSLFFLDYIACNKINSYIIEKIIHGITYSCKKTNTCFIGGETAEMSGLYPNNGYDIAGFCVGIVEKNCIINGKNLIKENDIIIGIPSSGVHSNGFSIIRNIFSHKDLQKSFNKKPLYESFLIPTKIYYNLIHIIIKKIPIHGIAHITGGGIYQNLSRIIPKGLSAIVKKKNIPTQPIFSFIKEKGNLSDKVMWNTFNMGVGLIIISSYIYKDKVLQELISINEKPFIIGNIIKTNNKSNKKVFLE
ncbi:phosphoribosylformylglycinamidine cyclo-ligase [Blattabacterium cuenoti]|uniref:phosphoribosylformylglycinamidine cyclo-ligase n=1 Tax=Blattabacterium cuenoti TaxID=1653831 RepID=UPI00163D17CF|nr:phosphoribosylformylglycinamidine cyclo-ligase [Blattabacterium cuenoti]